MLEIGQHHLQLKKTKSQLKVTHLHQCEIYRLPESPVRDCLKLVVAKCSTINCKKTQDTGKTYSFECI